MLSGTSPRKMFQNQTGKQHHDASKLYTYSSPTSDNMASSPPSQMPSCEPAMPQVLIHPDQSPCAIICHIRDNFQKCQTSSVQKSRIQPPDWLLIISQPSHWLKIRNFSLVVLTTHSSNTSLLLDHGRRLLGTFAT